MGDEYEDGCGVFWMIYVECRSSPTTKYFSLESALKEAKRICKKEEAKVHIMQVVKTVVIAESPLLVITYSENCISTVNQES